MNLKPVVLKLVLTCALRYFEKLHSRYAAKFYILKFMVFIVVAVFFICGHAF